MISYAFHRCSAPEVTVELEARPDACTAGRDTGLTVRPARHPLAPRLSDLKTAPMAGSDQLLWNTASALRYERVEG